MRNLLNPKWLLIINTAPLSLIFIIYLSGFTLIESLLDERSIVEWYTAGILFLVLILSTFIYVIYSMARKRSIQIAYALISLLFNISFLYYYWSVTSVLIPNSIPNWMLPSDTIFYISIALMPTLVHSIYIIVLHLTSSEKNTEPWYNFLGAISVPLSWYLFFQLVLPLWQPLGSDFTEHAGIIFLVITTVIFLFFVMRFVYLLGIRREKTWTDFTLTWRIIFAGVLPIVGLTLNQSHDDIFGNFTNPWFYIISVVNAVLVCIPPDTNPKKQLILFGLKSVTIVYIFYFFLVFLPYLPLSVLLIIIAGAGFLMLTPLILMIIQAKDLFSDFEFLSQYYSKLKLYGILISGLLFLPACVTVNYLNDKAVLNRALEYVFEDHDFNQSEPNIRLASLKRTLNTLKSHKSNDFDFATAKPILTPYFNWVVLDHMTLSEYKIHILEEVFFGSTTSTESRNAVLSATNRSNENIEILSAEATSHYDDQEKYWKTSVEFKIKNNQPQGFAEFVTNFDLPDGVWISDYYLWIDRVKEKGILSEKKAATWLYQQIVSGPRDPGIIHYTSGNNISFRIFPFKSGETRVSGIEFVHKEPQSIKIENHTIQLGYPQESLDDESVSFSNVHYVGRYQKQQLPASKRQPYLHFLLDYSIGNENKLETYLNQANKIERHAGFSLNDSKVSVVNTEILTTSLAQIGEMKLDSHGGFFLEKAFKKLLINEFIEPKNSFPVFIVLTDDINSAVFTRNLADYTFAIPENTQFYVLNSKGELTAHSLIGNTLKGIPISKISDSFDSTVLWTSPEGKDYYLAADDQPSIIPLVQLESVQNQKPMNEWEAALTAHAEWKKFRFGTQSAQKPWLNLVRSSFESQTMNPTTAFIALENESQKELLKRKQDLVLSGKHSLDLGEDIHRMSEPNIYWLIIAVLLLVLINRFRPTFSKSKALNETR
ncbi:MSEP-CTERM sorting domain-containing protein [Roseivirga sp. UBA1976]|uniref:MSEP-CTERM sorting domain-containing protein n=1 Tax=Roseivirga sp. UBA1976 TaxID=1947386 RepID=UPI0025801F11|nr:MSEP-CTERM sorting domain-containing protein [Roseivirga sp. UBA1976]MEC7752785.1 MSEP-CTERM sorting domain-containing protein [Bacteroidota bacterium]|tara:strand:+ start:12229 stop:15045 length:2817 start_codon:yes stop_codon:yes gene_type:complete